MPPVHLDDGIAELGIDPERGAGILYYRLKGNGGPLDVFLPAGTDSPDRLASIILAPWSNRIGGNGFAFGGRFHRLAPNVEGERFPIHGNAFQSAFIVERQSTLTAELKLQSAGPGPYRYTATVEYALDAGKLMIRLSLMNLGETLPFGLGLHPWFLRTRDTRVRFAAETIQLQDEDYLPDGSAPVSPGSPVDFRNWGSLPDGWINNAFGGWDRKAEMVWPDRGLRVELTASPALSTAIIFSPGRDAGFFCFEPVSHWVDAHRAPDPSALGLVLLESGASLTATCQFAAEHTVG